MRTTPKTITEKEVAARAATLMAWWGLAPPRWVFGFNRRRTQYGRCVHPSLWGPGRVELSEHHVRLNSADEVRQTILHEIAHALAGHKAGHGPAWVEKCHLVGCRPERCCTDGLRSMPAGRWRASCPSCGKVYRRHHRPRAGYAYHCPPCGPIRGGIVFRKNA